MNTATNAVTADVTAETQLVTNAVKRSPGRPRDPNGKYAKAVEIVTQLLSENKTRKYIIAELVAIGLKEGSATVYYHTIRKKLGSENATEATATEATATEAVAEEAVAEEAVAEEAVAEEAVAEEAVAEEAVAEEAVAEEAVAEEAVA